MKASRQKPNGNKIGLSNNHDGYNPPLFGYYIKSPRLGIMPFIHSTLFRLLED